MRESLICETTWKQFLSWLMCICLPSDWGAMQEKLTLSWPCPSLAHTTHCFLVLTQLGMWTVSKRPAGGCGLTVVFYGGTSTLHQNYRSHGQAPHRSWLFLNIIIWEPLLLFLEKNEAADSSHVHKVKKQGFPPSLTFTLDIVGGCDLISSIYRIPTAVVCLENLWLCHIIFVPNTSSLTLMVVLYGVTCIGSYGNHRYYFVVNPLQCKYRWIPLPPHVSPFLTFRPLLSIFQISWEIPLGIPDGTSGN